MDRNEVVTTAKDLLENGGLSNGLKRAIVNEFPELKDSLKPVDIREALIEEFVYLNLDKFGDLEINDILNWLNSLGEPEDKGEISDGYHTFNELYYYRMLYNAAFFNLLPKEWVYKSKKHSDGEDCFGGGWFIVVANLPTGQVSNHYELKDWDLFKIQEKEVADEWDGHTPQEAAERIRKYIETKENDSVENKWKPSDEQMLSLSLAFDRNDRVGYHLYTLYNDLKELKR